MRLTRALIRIAHRNAKPTPKVNYPGDLIGVTLCQPLRETDFAEPATALFPRHPPWCGNRVVIGAAVPRRDHGADNFKQLRPAPSELFETIIDFDGIGAKDGHVESSMFISSSSTVEAKMNMVNGRGLASPSFFCDLLGDFRPLFRRQRRRPGRAALLAAPAMVSLVERSGVILNLTRSDLGDHDSSADHVARALFAFRSSGHLLCPSSSIRHHLHHRVMNRSCACSNATAGASWPISRSASSTACRSVCASTSKVSTGWPFPGALGCLKSLSL